jgi:hypothetical protein
MSILALARQNAPEALAEALGSGRNPNEADQKGMTALMYAALGNQGRAMEILLDHGADPNLQDEGGFTALHFAAQAQAEACAKLLLQRGASADIKDKNGNTALFKAVFSYQEKGSLIPLLLQWGADPDTANLHGSSPRKLAALIANYSPQRFFSE